MMRSRLSATKHFNRHLHHELTHM